MPKTYNKFQQFVEDVAHGVHDLDNHQLMVALTNADNAPIATNSVLANLTQIDYSDLTTRNITKSASAQTDGTYKLTLTNLTLTANGDVPKFRYVVIYNDTPTDPLKPLIAWFDYGGDVDLHNGDTYTIDFDGTHGLLQIT